jgi:uncharacterized protein (DUF1015 family)
VAEIKPFRAVRYDERRAGPLDSLVAPPYDVIGPEERRDYLARNPYNVVRLTLPDSEEEAGRDFTSWRNDQILRTDEHLTLWALEQDYVGPDGVERTRRGLVTALRAEPYEHGVILPHERTHAGPKEGRLRLLRAVKAQLEPIFLLYDGQAPIAFPGGAPEVEAEGAGAVSRLWRIGDAAAREAAASWFADKTLLIADGHHRYETTLAFAAETESPATEFMLAVLVSRQDEGLEIFATHRVVERLSDTNGARAEQVAGGPVEGLRALEALDAERPAAILYRRGETLLLRGDEQEPDARFVERLGLEGLSYTPYADDAVARVDAGEAEAALLLRPPRVEQVAAVAERGETMPQKSTYFFPKLLSGLLFLPFDVL